VPIYIILLEVLSTEGHILNFSLLVKHEYFIIQTEVLAAKNQFTAQKDVAVGVFSNPLNNHEREIKRGTSILRFNMHQTKILS